MFANKSDIEIVSKCVSELFVNLYNSGIYIRIFITKGDFSFHELEFTKNSNSLVCPIYGTTLLDAYEMDSRGYKTLGVLLTEKASSGFKTLGNVQFSDGSRDKILDIEKYLDKKKYRSFYESICHFDENIQNFIKNFENATREYSKLFSLTITQQDVENIINEVSEKKVKENSVLNQYLSNLKEALAGNDITIKVNKKIER